MEDIHKSVKAFAVDCKPLETGNCLVVLVDRRTNASYCECHIKASTLSRYATIDVPLDPAAQSQYRANREVLTDDPAFKKMQDDAKQGRAFSNIVAEYTKEFDPDHPLKIVGGQHRFRAINDALQQPQSVDEYHGVKVYFLLDKTQKLEAVMKL